MRLGISKRLPIRSLAAATGGVALAVVVAAGAQEGKKLNPLNPDSEGHFTIPNPANLQPAETEQVYRRILPTMKKAMDMSDNRDAKAYTKWRRFNSAPYRSAQHGQRYVNNYGNRTGEAYGGFENAGVMPVGTVLAKDAFSVDKQGRVRPGPLFIMEKMDKGFNAPSGNWRYVMILPDGSLLGETNGENSENVAFCVPCHAAEADRDHLFFLPKEFRAAR